MFTFTPYVVRANLSENEETRMSEEEMIAQIMYVYLTRPSGPHDVEGRALATPK